LRAAARIYAHRPRRENNPRAGRAALLEIRHCRAPARAPTPLWCAARREARESRAFFSVDGAHEFGAA
jgi:hypothetical protein